MSANSKNFEIPPMTNHDAEEDIVADDVETDGMAFEGFKNEASYVPREEVSNETVQEAKRVVVKLRGRNLLRMASALLQ